MTLAAVEEYGVDRLLAELRDDLLRGVYHPLPVRRVEIPKPDGRSRPLGIPTVRDRVVQQAAKLVLEPIFEADFLPCSFGFRPRRSATDALEVIRVRKGLLRTGVGPINVAILLLVWRWWRKRPPVTATVLT